MALKHYDRTKALDPTNLAHIANQAAVFFEKGNYKKCFMRMPSKWGGRIEKTMDQTAKTCAPVGNSCLKEQSHKDAIHLYKSLEEHQIPDVLKKGQQAEKILKEQEPLANINLIWL
jgi:stress-induced-phosphoprotein 1